MQIKIDIMKPAEAKGLDFEGAVNAIGLAEHEVEKLKRNNITALRLSTLARICEGLDCHPSDVLSEEA